MHHLVAATAVDLEICILFQKGAKQFPAHYDAAPKIPRLGTLCLTSSKVHPTSISKHTVLDRVPFLRIAKKTRPRRILVNYNS